MDLLIKTVQEKLREFVGYGIEMLPKIVLAIIVVFLTRTAARIVRAGVGKLSEKTIKSRSLQALLIQTSNTATWVIGILFACTLLFDGLRVGDLIGFLGLGSVAIGFAFQDIFKNFLAGVLLLLQEPFSLGDQIIVDDFEGTVSDIALRSTQIRTYQGEVVVIPNSVVFTSPVQVMTGNDHRRTDLSIGVDYNTPLPKAVKTLFDAATAVEEVISSPAVEVDVIGFGDSSIDLVVRYWTDSQKKCVRRIKTQVMMALKQACDQAEISIPYPIRTVYHFDQERYRDNELIEHDRQDDHSFGESHRDHGETAESRNS